MQEPLQAKGYWWTPEAPEKRLPGTLSYIPGEDIVLETFGSFDEPHAFAK